MYAVVSSQPTQDAQRLLRQFATKAFRRPVTDATLSPYVALAKSEFADGTSFEDALRTVYIAVLCAPNFLYLQEPPGTLDDYALASRLSYFLWSSLPDDELLAAAARGELKRPDVLRAQTDRLLRDPRAMRFTRNFVGQWLNLRDIEFTIPDKQLYPEFDPLLLDAMVQETERFFAEMLAGNRPVHEFIDSDWTMLNERLAQHYRIDGVLVDSYRPHWESWRQTAAEVGRELSETKFVQTFCRTSREIIAEHWGRGALSDVEIAEFDRRKEALYREIVAVDFPAMDGAAELIRSLHADGFRLAVGSSGPPENVAMAIDRLGVASLFQTLVTGADILRGKPDPQVFQIAAERLGVPPVRCAVIEDAPVGIAAANAAGMTSIAFVSTGHTRDSVAAADVIVDSLRELSPDRMVELISHG
jgi:HAD superfamily hydrolase (TIGR01509 family)